MEIVEKIYVLTKKFPREEMYGLTSQIRRAAISIPSNIAEGSQRNSRKDFSHFISIAKGSVAELETQLILASKFEYVETNAVEELRSKLEELSKMLHGFHSQLILENSSLKPHTSQLS